MSWTVVFPVSNIQLNARTYNIGNLTFYNQNVYNINQNWSFPQNIMTSINNNYANKIIVEVTGISANNVDEAINYAILNLSRVFDLFSITYYQTHQKIVISEPNLDQDFHVLIRDLSTNTQHFKFQRSQFLKILNINQRNIRKIGILQNIFHFTSKPLTNYSKLERRISDCLHWCRKGNIDTRPEDRLLNYIVGLEHLLLKSMKTGSKTVKISKRTAKILGLSIKHRNRIRDNIKNAYILRSKIVHEAYTNLTQDEKKLIEKIRHYTYFTAQNMASLAKKRRTLTYALKLNEKKLRERRKKRKQRLNSSHVVINNVPKLIGTRTRYYSGTGKLKKLTGSLVADMNVIIRLYDDKEYIYIDGYGKNFSNTNLTLSSNDTLFIENKIPVLNKKIILEKIDFDDDIVLQLPNKIRNNQNIKFTAYDYVIKRI